MSSILMFIKSLFGIGRKANDTFQLQGLNNGTTTQLAANNVADLGPAGDGGLVSTRLSRFAGVEQHGIKAEAQNNAGEPAAEAGDEVVPAGAVEDGGPVVGGQVIGAAQVNGIVVVEAGGVVNHDGQHQSAFNLPLEELVARPERCHLRTTTSTTPLVDDAGYHSGDDVEAQQQGAQNSRRNSNCTIRGMQRHQNRLLRRRCRHQPNHSIGWFQRLRNTTLYQKLAIGVAMVGILIGFVACVGTLYYGYHEKKQYTQGPHLTRGA